MSEILSNVSDAFPLPHLESSRRDRRLQAENRELVEEARRANPDVVCPQCGSGSELAWFSFRSPEWTWENLCGRAGVVAFCDAHERQAIFVLHLMN